MDPLPSPNLPGAEFQLQAWRWMRSIVEQLRALQRQVGMLQPGPPSPPSDAPEPVAGLPEGGQTGTVLSKLSSADYDAGWRVVREVPPTGPQLGYVLATSLAAPYYAWVPASSFWSGGGGGSGLGPPTQAGDVLTLSTDLQPVWSTPYYIPAGGAIGQMLVKASSADYDVIWTDQPVGLPAGGASGQVLVKASASDHDVQWADPVRELPETGAPSTVLVRTGTGPTDYQWAPVPESRVVVLAAAYTPTSVGADPAELIIPPDATGAAITWQITQLWVRVQLANIGDYSHIRFEKSAGAGSFSPVSVADFTLDADEYEAYFIPNDETITTGDKLRFVVLRPGNAEYWTVGAVLRRMS